MNILVIILGILTLALFFYLRLTEIQRRLGILINLKRKELGVDADPTHTFFD